MEKINLREKLQDGGDPIEIIKRFLLQLDEEYIEQLKKMNLTEEIKKEWIDNAVQRCMDSYVVKMRCIDPRVIILYGYAICSEENINKLISFEEEYVTYKKKIKKIKKLRSRKSMKFEVWEICYKEQWGAYDDVVLKIVKNDEGGYHVKDILVAEDDLYFAKEMLNYIGVIF